MTIIQKGDQASEILTKIQREMAIGEKLRWTGWPGRAALARSQLPVGLFGLAFFVFAIFWIVLARNMGRHPSDTLISYFWMAGIPFALIGLWLLLKPAVAAISAGSMLYAISDRRVVIVTQFPRYRVKSYAPTDLDAVERRENSDGTGDIIFGQEKSHNSSPWPGNGVSIGTNASFEIPRKIGFFGISEVRSVEALVHQLRARPNT